MVAACHAMRYDVIYALFSRFAERFMKNSIFKNLGVTILLLVLSPLAHGGGTVHGGGGNICDGGAYPANLSELADTAPGKTDFPDQTGVRFSGKYLQETLEVFGYFGFDLMGGGDDTGSFFQNGEVRKLLKNRINQYLNRAELNPTAASVFKNLEAVIGAHPFLIFNDTIDNPIAPGDLTKKYCPGHVKAVIRFSLGFGFLSLVSFNDMSLNQQSWLLIHESLRWIQQNLKNSKFTDSSVERLTRAIILNDFSSEDVQNDLKILSSDSANFLKFNKASPAISKFYDDVIYEGPIAIFNDLMAMDIAKFHGTVDEWAAQTSSTEVLRYRERAKNLLSLTNAYITGANYSGWKKDDISYHIMRIDMYGFWKRFPFRTAYGLINSTLAAYSEAKLQHVFKVGELDLDQRLLGQDEKNILSPDSSLTLSSSGQYLESCACAQFDHKLTQAKALPAFQEQLLKLFEQSMTLSFNGGARKFYALPYYDREQAFCIAITKGNTSAGINANTIANSIRPTLSLNLLGLNKCRAVQ